MPIATNPMALLLLLAAVALAVKFLVSGRGSKAGYSFTGCPLAEAKSAFIACFRWQCRKNWSSRRWVWRRWCGQVTRARNSRFTPAFRAISQKRIDFVVCDRDSMEVRCLVELDDSSHDAQRDQVRDAITAQAGYRTVRVRARRRYDIDGLRNRVLGIQPEPARLSG